MRLNKLVSTEENASIGRNLTYAIIAQGIAFLSSVIMSLVVPKLLGIESYAYWQLFIMYTSYTGLFLLGVNDGIYLRLGGMRYKELDRAELRSQYVVILLSQLIVAAGCAVLLSCSDFEQDRKIVLLFVLVYGIAANMQQCLTYMFQCVNLTRITSFASMMNKAAFLPLILLLLALGIDRALPLILVYTACQYLSLAYCMICARDILLHARGFSLAKALKNSFVDISSGIKIMASYYADTSVVALTRMLADARLGLVVFGKLSFSLSLINFLLNFIGQFAMVIFPVLRRQDEGDKVKNYLLLRQVLHTVLPIAYLAYPALVVFVGAWLPEYRESLKFLGLLMPFCFYSCKANVIFNTYMKVDRNETGLLAINTMTMLFNLAVSFVAIWIFSSIELSCLGIVVSVAFRDYLFEQYMGRHYTVNYLRGIVAEFALSVCVMTLVWIAGAGSFFGIAMCIVLYLLVDREGSKEVATMLAKRASRGTK